MNSHFRTRISLVKIQSLQSTARWIPLYSCFGLYHLLCPFSLGGFCFQRKITSSYIVSLNSNTRTPPHIQTSVLRITEGFKQLIPALCHCPTVYSNFSSRRWITRPHQLSTWGYRGGRLPFRQPALHAKSVCSDTC